MHNIKVNVRKRLSDATMLYFMSYNKCRLWILSDAETKTQNIYNKRLSQALFMSYKLYLSKIKNVSTSSIGNLMVLQMRERHTGRTGIEQRRDSEIGPSVGSNR